MTTYKEKYRLKKTEPIKNPKRIAQLNYPKQSAKTQKANTINTVLVQRRNIKDRFLNQTTQNAKEQKPKKDASQNNLQQKNQNQSSQVTIKERALSVSIVHKFIPSSNYAPLSYPKKGAISSIEKINILNSVQNFFTRIIKPDNGCICEQPCQWASKLFKWIDTPQFLVIQHFQKLKQQIKSRTKKRKQSDSHYFQSVEEQQKDQQIQKSFKQIRKDIQRTQSDSLTFRTQVFRYRLQNILKCYVIEDTKIGYVQGMNMILSGILYHVKDEAKSYGIFRRLLYSIRTIYLDSFRDSYLHVNKIEHLIKTHLFDVYMRLGQLDIELHMICLPWILSLLTSIVPLDSLHLIYYGFIKEKWSFIYKVCLSIFAYFKDRILQETDGSEVLILFSPGQEEIKEIDWEDIVKYAENIQVRFDN